MASPYCPGKSCDRATIILIIGWIFFVGLLVAFIDSVRRRKDGKSHRFKAIIFGFSLLNAFVVALQFSTVSTTSWYFAEDFIVLNIFIFIGHSFAQTAARIQRRTDLMNKIAYPFLFVVEAYAIAVACYNIWLSEAREAEIVSCIDKAWILASSNAFVLCLFFVFVSAILLYQINQADSRSQSESNDHGRRFRRAKKIQLMSLMIFNLVASSVRWAIDVSYLIHVHSASECDAWAFKSPNQHIDNLIYVLMRLVYRLVPAIAVFFIMFFIPLMYKLCRRRREKKATTLAGLAEKGHTAEMTTFGQGGKFQPTGPTFLSNQA